jgi:hypothetical protein
MVADCGGVSGGVGVDETGIGATAWRAGFDGDDIVGAADVDAIRGRDTDYGDFG